MLGETHAMLGNYPAAIAAYEESGRCFPAIQR